jgi:hypothetical protein
MDAAKSEFSYVNPIWGLDIFSDPVQRIQVSPALARSERTFIAIIEGQSLAANHCQGLYHPRATKVQCVNVLGDRRLYQHREPMMGASFYADGYAGYQGGYGSVWGKVGDLLIERGIADRVIWCNVAYGGQSAEALSPDGVMGHRMPLAFRVLRSLGFDGSTVSAILSMQGESDNGLGTPAAAYKQYRRQTIQVSRDIGFAGPWFIPLETYSFGKMSNTIRGAQLDLAIELAGVITGPDFDTLDASYRYAQEDAAHVGNGKVHPNEAGRDAIAEMWAHALARHLK